MVFALFAPCLSLQQEPMSERQDSNTKTECKGDTQCICETLNFPHKCLRPCLHLPVHKSSAAARHRHHPLGWHRFPLGMTGQCSHSRYREPVPCSCTALPSPQGLVPAQHDDGLCLAAAAMPSPTPVPNLAAILPSQTPNPSLPTSSTNAALGKLISLQWPGLSPDVHEQTLSAAHADRLYH